jgi:hypothetical protein
MMFWDVGAAAQQMPVGIPTKREQAIGLLFFTFIFCNYFVHQLSADATQNTTPA